MTSQNLFQKLLDRAGAITCDDGAFVMDWNTADQTGDPENMVLGVRWYERGTIYGHDFTEAGVREAKIDQEGIVLLPDDEGEMVAMRFYSLDRITNPLAGDRAAVQFFTELTEAYESLTGIAEQHDASTLAHLMYLQQAILKNGFIELTDQEEAVREIVASLPSAAIWQTFVR